MNTQSYVNGLQEGQAALIIIFKHFDNDFDISTSFEFIN